MKTFYVEQNEVKKMEKSKTSNSQKKASSWAAAVSYMIPSFSPSVDYLPDRGMVYNGAYYPLKKSQKQIRKRARWTNSKVKKEGGRA